MRTLSAVRCQFVLKGDPVAVTTHRGLVIFNTRGAAIAVFDMNGMMVNPHDIKDLTPGLATFTISDAKE